MIYKTLIVDDERLAREEVRRALKGYPEFCIVGEANNVEVAIGLIETEQPDILFLDIYMPEKSGFDLLDELGTVPEVIFTTAYDQYAVKAFEVNALDYLVKPLREERFAKAIKKVKIELKKKAGEKEAPFASHQKIFIKDGEKVHFIALGDISLIESMDNYAQLHFGNEKAMIKRSLNLLEKKLDPHVFFRANRGQIINTEYIRDIQPYFNNRLRIVLTTGKTIEVSSRQSVLFKKLKSL
ncbi:LytR/AlgR family response regulator transcription factor [Galbibacter pacificus]|uniref:LytTR family DNA-binding domain-containing protein n=1 Tax=Galbibacter pacificus TaxID=2996052 RepID=A0ABT6FSD0_9FLAO|nr:LytTR family DNA-binding domain-containing protein [Galbibacter pacificus]MDG3582927.1 LytTR family DNA-binding domain-containing protein [Galbibacter pacificus]MDG3585954.1 LytTR family DNA-binding domain-containing protein [Galbibacter pacificus]